MATLGSTPPTICKVRKVVPAGPDANNAGDCITVTKPWVYVVLSENPDNLTSATVSWDSTYVPVTVIEGDNLMLRGSTGDGTIADMVEVRFEGLSPTSEPASTVTCVPGPC